MRLGTAAMTTRVAIESFFPAGPDDAAVAVVERALSGRGGYACLANVHVVVTANRDYELCRALEDAWVVFPDGWPVAWLQRRVGLRRAARVAGPDLMPRVVALGQEAGMRHFLFGSTNEVLERLERALRARYPDANIVGVLAPAFGATLDSRADGSLDLIAAARPHVVWCALGAPRQELWMRAHADSLRPAVVLGVGAAFDFLSGTKRRAPLWMQRAGLEWFHRLVTEPRRLWLRYSKTNAAFVAFAASAIRARRNSTRFDAIGGARDA